MNPLAVGSAAAAYWVLGAIWYSTLFGGVWSRGLEKQGVRLPEPSGGQMAVKLASTFAANLGAAVALALLLARAEDVVPADGVRLGLITGAGIAAMALGVADTWESRPLTVFLVESSYHVAGNVAAGLILAAWR